MSLDIIVASGPLPTVMISDTSFEQKVYIAQVEKAYESLPGSLLVNLINSSILVYINWREIAFSTLIIWFACLSLISSGRFVCYLYKRNNIEIDPRQWGNVYIAGLVLAGIVWGAAGILLFPENNPAHQILITFVLGGMVAGAIVTSSPLSNAFYFYLIPVLLPILFNYFFMYEGIVGYTMFLMILLFALFSIVINRRVYDTIHSLITARIKMDEESRARKDAEKNAREHQEFLEAVLYNIQDGVVACDETGRLNLFNRAAEEFHNQSQLNIPPEEWASQYDLYNNDGKTLMYREDVPLYRAFNGELVRNQEMQIIPKDGRKRIVVVNGQPLIGEDGKKIGAVISMNDITEVKKAQIAIQNAFDALEMTIQDRTEELVAVNRELRLEIEQRRKAEQETLKVIAQLKDALSKVKTLSGFIPICASCKKIRDDKGFWNRIEEYIEQHSEAEFSHGICPDCFKEKFPEDYEEIYGKDE